MIFHEMNGEDIKELRESLNLNQEDFSRKFRIPFSILVAWEQGDAKPSSAELSLLNILKQLTKRRESTQNFLYGLMFEPK